MTASNALVSQPDELLPLDERHDQLQMLRNSTHVEELTIQNTITQHEPLPLIPDSFRLLTVNVGAFLDELIRLLSRCTVTADKRRVGPSWTAPGLTLSNFVALATVRHSTL